MPLSAARNEGRSESLASPVESAFLAQQAVENLPLPALPNALNPYRRKADDHLVFEARTEESVDVMVGGSTQPAMLMDGEHALRAPCCAREGFSTASRRTGSQKVPSSARARGPLRNARRRDRRP